MKTKTVASPLRHTSGVVDTETPIAAILDLTTNDSKEIMTFQFNALDPDEMEVPKEKPSVNELDPTHMELDQRKEVQNMLSRYEYM